MQCAFGENMNITKSLLCSALMTAATVGAAVGNAAQADGAAQYPTKPVRFIVPFQAGGANDLTARAIAQKLTERWGRQVVADNRAGAAGSVGVDATARAVPDGYTIAIISASQAVNAGVSPRLPYDLTKDLQAISQVSSLFYMVTVHPSVPATSVRELIAYARANPGKIDYGSSGTFGLQHLSGELFQHLTGTKLVHVPYKGGAAALADILTGQIKMGFSTLLSARPHITSGRVRALAVTTRARAPAVPDLPTLAEAGVPGFEVDQWFGIVTPAKVPPAIISKLARVITEVVHAPDVAQRFSTDGSTPVGSTPEAFGIHIRNEVAKWRRLAKEAGLRME
jgi:tripartite-type tricarboxylate transporter receptor subunit TctC